MNEADNPGSERRLKLRKTPRQERSIQRLEAILAAATDLLAEKGVQGLKMTEIAAAAGISIGSLYQFFPERAAVLRALHDQHTQRVELGARRAFAGVDSLEQAIERLASAVDRFYEVFRDDPVYRPVWLAAKSDRDLQVLNHAHQERLASDLAAIFRPLLPTDVRIDLKSRLMLYVHLTGSVVLWAMISGEDEAQRMLGEWKDNVRKTMFSP